MSLPRNRAAMRFPAHPGPVHFPDRQTSQKQAANMPRLRLPSRPLSARAPARDRLRDFGSGQAIALVAAKGRALRLFLQRHGRFRCIACADKARQGQRDGDDDRCAIAEYGNRSRMPRSRIGVAMRTNRVPGAGLRAACGAGGEGHGGIAPPSVRGLACVNMLPIIKHMRRWSKRILVFVLQPVQRPASAGHLAVFLVCGWRMRLQAARR